MDRPPPDHGTIEELELEGPSRRQPVTTFWDRALLGVFAVALGAGVVMGVTNLGGSVEAADASPSPSRLLTGAITPLPDPSGFPTPRPERSIEPEVQTPWRADATAYRGFVGERYIYACPAHGEAAEIWGTRIYTDDSSVCTAAVHRGLITLDLGGTVTIEMRPGRLAYPGSRHHGITSLRWAEPWDGSFVFVE